MDSHSKPVLYRELKLDFTELAISDSLAKRVTSQVY